MTIDIDAIRQREQAATEGPWPLITDACGCNGEYPCGHGDYPIGFGPFYSVEHSGTEQPHADHVFAAHARQDIPDLLAKVDELKGRLDSARATCDAYKDAPPPLFQGPGLSERGEGYNAGTRDMARAVLRAMSTADEFEAEQVAR